MASSLNQGVLVTIICETVLQDRMIHLMKTINASGYTIVQAQGAGSHGRRMGDIAGYKTNIEVKTIVSSEAADQLLEEVRQLQDKHALIAYRQKVDGIFD